MKTPRAILTAAFCALQAACSPLVGTVNLLVPKNGYSAHRDLAYGPDARQKLDIYVPDGLNAPAPVVLFFYGGSWDSGSKSQYLAFGQALASKGVIAVVADYRIYPQVKFPAFVEDGASAFRFVHDRIAGYGGDPKRLFLAGHSAGAYIAVMLASNLSYLKTEGLNASSIAGVIGIAGPYDFLPLTDPKLIEIFGGARNTAMLPITYIDGTRPPMLLVTGNDDSTVDPGNTTRMTARLRAVHSPVEEIIYPGVGHIGIILSLVPGFRGRTSLRDDIIRFVGKY